MRRPLSRVVALSLLVLAHGCASHVPAKRTVPPPISNGSLVITSGIRIANSTILPAGFAADPGYPPFWLQGNEIASAGKANGKSVVLGLSGPDWSVQRVIAEDFGVGAPHGKILDLAPSPDGLTVATAVAEPQENRVEIMLRATLSDDARPVASFDGAFSWAQLKWLDGATLALATRSEPAGDGAAPVSSLNLITVAGAVEVKPLTQITCALSPLSFSRDGRLAVAQGDANGPPELLDLQAGTCAPLTIHEAIQMLAWAPDNSAFLYLVHGEDHVPAIFCYDLASGRSTVVAISSGAAAYASDGTIVVAGSDALSWRRATQSTKPITVQIALIVPGHGQIAINALGFTTLPAMLARSSMVFSEESDVGLMDIASPAAAGAQRQLIEYSYPSRSAFVLATAPAGAPLALSWSPDGKFLAVVDAGVQPNRLTVLMPPR